MTLRGRLGAAASLAVAGVVIAVAIVVYVVARAELRAPIDRSLAQFAAPFTTVRHVGPPAGDGGGPGFGGRPPDGGGGRGGGGGPPATPEQLGGPSGYLQFVRPDGSVTRPNGETRALPVDAATTAVARGTHGSFFSETTLDGVHLRILTAPDADGGAVQVARPLTEVDRTLSRLLVALIVIGACGIALAALLGVLVARAALAPIARFTRRTEDLTARPDPTRRLEVTGRDELARLARSFNVTLDALERSVDAQRNLVADASHELRTPIASLRANIQMLGEADRLPRADRDSLRADIVEELDALTALIADVVDLARGSEQTSEPDDVALGDIVEAAVERARRRAPSLRFDTAIEPTVVHGTPERIARAVANLLDNAAKFSPDGGVVTVRLEGGALSVTDEGPGIDPADLPHVFDRFYRADLARPMPGSGLGLAIVRQAAEAHGGYARAETAAGGGARLEVFFGPPLATGEGEQAVAGRDA